MNTSLTKQGIQKGYLFWKMVRGKEIQWPSYIISITSYNYLNKNTLLGFPSKIYTFCEIPGSHEFQEPLEKEAIFSGENSDPISVNDYALQGLELYTVEIGHRFSPKVPVHSFHFSL